MNNIQTARKQKLVWKTEHTCECVDDFGDQIKIYIYNGEEKGFLIKGVFPDGSWMEINPGVRMNTLRAAKEYVRNMFDYPGFTVSFF